MKRTNPKPKNLTYREYDVLRAIKSFKSTEGRTPSFREIGEALKLSHTRVGALIKPLKEKGYIEIETDHGKRSRIKLLRKIP